MFQSLIQSQKSRRDYLTKLFDALNSALPAYLGATVSRLPDDHSKNKYLVKIVKEALDLKRVQKLQYQSQYLLEKDTSSDQFASGKVQRLTTVPLDASGQSSLMLASQSPWSDQLQVRFRKGEKNDKDLYIEVWRDEEQGFISAKKVTDKCSKVYNDAIFGTVSWSKDETKIVFIGERPEPAAYKNYWEDDNGGKKKDPEEEEKKSEEEKKKEEDKEQHFLDEKYQYTDDFGETLVGKKRPAIFVFNLIENTIEEVQGIDSTLHPAYPQFDETSNAIVFVGYSMPIHKIGMNFCLNKDTKLYYIRDPITDKKKLKENKPDNYVQCLNSTEFASFMPKFSRDYSRLLYFGAQEKFISHSGNYQMRYFKWPIQVDNEQSTLVIDKHQAYPKEGQDFVGLFGYNQSYIHSGFLGESNRYALFESTFKGQERLYVTDIDTKEVRWLNFLNKQGESAMDGEYELHRTFEDTLIIKYSNHTTPPIIYALQFKNIDTQSLTELLDSSNLSLTIVDQLKFNSQKSDVEKEIATVLPTITKEVIALENGAEAYFIRSSLLDATKKHPMIVILHGGPFGCSPQDMFLQMRTYFVLQGYQLLIVNYRGSTGYGEDFLNSLLGHIGERDIEDQGNLTKMALEKFADKIDLDRVGVYGGSHGGFSTGWQIGHPEFKHLYKAAVLWNPVLNMSYMYAATDIPDWIYACCLNKDLSYQVTAEDNTVFFNRSPVSVAKNVTTPSLILIGQQDKRVPPHQGYHYYHTLKQQGVKTKIYNYPEDGHAIGSTEPGLDATMNISLWFDEIFQENLQKKAEQQQ
eukprot:403350033